MWPAAGFLLLLVNKQQRDVLAVCLGWGIPPVVENRSRCSTSLTLSSPLFDTDLRGLAYIILLVITVIIVFTILYSVEITLYVTFHKVLSAVKCNAGSWTQYRRQ